MSEPRQEGDGLTWVRASKPFATVAEAGQVASELSGPDGPFREFRLERTRSFLKTRTTFTGSVDLTKGLTGLSDPGLQERLGDADLELDPDGLRRRFGNDVDKSVRVRVEAKLPGDLEAEGSTPIRDGVAWQPVVGEQARLHAVAEAWNLQPVVPALAALLFVAAAVVLVMRRRA